MHAQYNMQAGKLSRPQHAVALRVFGACDDRQPGNELIQVDEAVAIAIQLFKRQVHPAGPELILLQL